MSALRRLAGSPDRARLKVISRRAHTHVCARADGPQEPCAVVPADRASCPARGARPPVAHREHGGNAGDACLTAALLLVGALGPTATTRSHLYEKSGPVALLANKIGPMPTHRERIVARRVAAARLCALPRKPCNPWLIRPQICNVCQLLGLAGDGGGPRRGRP